MIAIAIAVLPVVRVRAAQAGRVAAGAEAVVLRADAIAVTAVTVVTVVTNKYFNCTGVGSPPYF